MGQNSAQEWADIRIPQLFHVPAAVRGLSIEPLLGPLDLGLGRIWCRHHLRFEDVLCMDDLSPCFSAQAVLGDLLDWIIVGGESGPHARPMHPEWVCSIRDQCQDAGVPFFFKQWGEWLPFFHAPEATLQSMNIENCKTEFMDQHSVHRVGKKFAGRELDGRTWDEFPKAGAALKTFVQILCKSAG